MPRIRDAIRRTLNRRMHCPFVRDYDAIELGLVVCHSEYCAQTGCLSLRNNVHKSRRENKGGEGKKGAAIHRPFPERRPAHNKRLILGDQAGSIALTRIVPVEASRTPVTFTLLLTKP